MRVGRAVLLGVTSLIVTCGSGVVYGWAQSPPQGSALPGTTPDPSLQALKDRVRAYWEARIRKDYRPGLEKFTFFPFRTWRPGMTGLSGAGGQVDRDEAREKNCVRLFQFLVSFTQ